MNSNPTSYPLSWPPGFKRTPANERTWSQFNRKVQRPGQTWKATERLTVAQAVERLMKSVCAFTRNGQPWRINPDFLVVSTNIRTRADGLPMSGQKEPEDPGVAVYFELDESRRVMCCDKWTRVADNIASIAATLEAMRGLERWGVTESERAFTGFAALPEPGKAQARTCWQVLGIERTLDVKAINDAWRKCSQICHPDRPGGSHDAMAELNTARDQALAEIQSA